MSPILPVVELKDVYFKHGRQTVLQEVNFRLFNNDFLLVLGPNGGGKTSLLKLILGINKPFSGSVRLFGKSPYKTNYLVGYVPQNIRVNESFPISVKQVTALGGIFLSIDKKKALKGMGKRALPTLDVPLHKSCSTAPLL